MNILSRNTILLILIPVLLLWNGASCARFKTAPPPPGVPENSIHDRKTGLWSNVSPEGTYRLFYRDGVLGMSGRIVGNLREGLWRQFGMDGKVVTTEGLFLNDWKEGIWKYYDSEGRLYLEMRYAQSPRREFGFIFTHDYGNENGAYRLYFPNGKLEEEGNFTSGYYEGPMNRYFLNGKKAAEGSYHLDNRNGVWRFYYPEGNLEREETYRDGLLEGPFHSFYPNGNPYVETRYSGGKNIGPQKIHPPVRQNPAT